jgi:hypothetical protein
MPRSSHVVYKNPYGKFQKHAEQELELLGQERDRLVQRTAEIDERERQIREYLKALAPLMARGPEPALADVGVTNLCRQIIDTTPRWMTAPEVRKTLEGMGMDISSYTNPMSVLHSILHRVAASYHDAEGKLYFGRPDLAKPPGSGKIIAAPVELRDQGKTRRQFAPLSGVSRQRSKGQTLECPVRDP